MARKIDRKSRPTFDALESREVLSISTPTLSYGVLTIRGNSSNDNVLVYNDANNGNVIVQDKTNSNWWRFNQYSVGRVDLFGNDGNDTLKNQTAVSTQAFGGKGNDWLEGGSGNDLLDGGDNWDTLVGNAGNDSLYGGYGNDALYGGSGKDYLNGGYDSDYMEDYAWEANTFYDIWGSNTIRKRTS